MLHGIKHYFFNSVTFQIGGDSVIVHTTFIPVNFPRKLLQTNEQQIDKIILFFPLLLLQLLLLLR